MKLLLDQGLPRSAAPLLRAAEIDTLHVGEVGDASATDAADFHAFLALSGASLPSVIRMRVEGLRASYRRSTAGRLGPMRAGSDTRRRRHGVLF